MCRFRLMFSLSLVRSTYIQRLPFGLGTTIILAHQSVGCSTLVITPIAFILSSFCFTFGIRGNGILLGLEIAKGLVPSRKLMQYSPVIIPKPLNRFGYIVTNFSSCRAFILAIRFKDSIQKVLSEAFELRKCFLLLP